MRFEPARNRHFILGMDGAPGRRICSPMALSRWTPRFRIKQPGRGL